MITKCLEHAASALGYARFPSRLLSIKLRTAHVQVVTSFNQLEWPRRNVAHAPRSEGPSKQPSLSQCSNKDCGEGCCVISEVNRSIITLPQYCLCRGEWRGQKEKRIRRRRTIPQQQTREVLRWVCLAHLANHSDRNLHKTNYTDKIRMQDNMGTDKLNQDLIHYTS